MVAITRSVGRVENARKTETIKRAMKAFSFKLDVRYIIAIILIPTRIEINKTLINCSLIYVKNR